MTDHNIREIADVLSAEQRRALFGLSVRWVLGTRWFTTEVLDSLAGMGLLDCWRFPMRPEGRRHYRLNMPGILVRQSLQGDS